MTSSTALILASVLGISMAVIEALHFRHVRRITFLSITHVLIFVGHCLPPFLITMLPGTPWESGPYGAANPNPWGIRLYIIDLAEALNLPGSAYVTAGHLLIGGYVVLVGSYFLFPRDRIRPLDSRSLPQGGLTACGLVLGAVAAIALFIYASQFGGLSRFIQSGLYIRRGTMEVQWGSLQVLAQIAFPAFLFLAAAASWSKGRRRALLALAAAAVWAVVAFRLVHVGGRLETAAVLITPVLAWSFITQPGLRTTAILLGIAILGLFLASVDPIFFRDPIGTFSAEFTKLRYDLVNSLLYILAYLGFPHINAAHALTVVPGDIPFRYFVDIPLGLAYMLPNFSGVETLPPMILSLHVKLLPWIPVDLFSFGYYSLGTVGVLISFAAFGALLAMFDGWLTKSTGWLGQALRAAWLFYLPFRLLYADPYATLQSGFGLITGTLTVIALALWAAWRRDRPKRL